MNSAASERPQEVSDTPSMTAAMTACAVIGLLWMTGLLVCLSLGLDRAATLWLIYPLPLLPVAMSLIVRHNLRQARVPRPLQSLLWCGLIWIIGGASFDLFSTLWHSPDLSEEGNVILRELLDMRHSLQQVYLFGAAMNFVFTWMFCELWRGMLIQLPGLAREVARHRPTDRLQFLKSATGGGHLTWRQWLIPFRLSELPRLEFWIWPTVIAVTLSASTLRWYAGLEWFGVFHPELRTRALVLTTTAAVGLTGYFALIQRICRDLKLQDDSRLSDPLSSP